MKKYLQKLAIAWIAMLGIIGINKERLARNEEKSKAALNNKRLCWMSLRFRLTTVPNHMHIVYEYIDPAPFGGIFCYNCRLPPSNTYRPTRS